MSRHARCCACTCVATCTCLSRDPLSVLLIAVDAFTLKLGRNTYTKSKLAQVPVHRKFGLYS